MTKRIGIYIHIPFCVSKCAYCDFISLAGQEKLMPRYHQALKQQIKESSLAFSGNYIDTIYFGGGTPSYYGAKRIVDLFNTLKDNYNVLINSEVTFEANPESIRTNDLRLLHKAGVNRISIGVQTTDDALAKSIGRRHTFAQVQNAMKKTRAAGFQNTSVDLIYGLPGQTRADWVNTLNKILSLRPDHISCYGLRIEKNTPLYAYKNSPDIPNEDTQADMYLYAVDALKNTGYRQYEISNFALPGKESLHNLKYWRSQDYVGFGAGAHSCVMHTRYANHADVMQYIEAVESGGSLLAHTEDISRNEQAMEYIMLGLRTTRGITGEEYYSIYESSFTPLEDHLLTLEKQGLAQRINHRWILTPQGFLVSNTIIRELLDRHAGQRYTAKMSRKQATEPHTT